MRLRLRRPKFETAQAKLADWRMATFDSKRDHNSGGIRRRDLLASVALGLAGSALPGIGQRVSYAVDLNESPAEAKGLTAYESQKQVFVRWNNSVVVTYRAHDSLKFPYFGPLIGPTSGISMTTESSIPYPHHRGIWIGCEPLNGGDYWSDRPLESGRIASAGPTVSPVENSCAEIKDHCEWLRQDAPSPLEDRRRIVVCIPSERMRVIDVELELIAREDISITSAKHSFFALRTASDLAPINGGVLVNSSGGQGAAGTYGRPAAWCDYYATRQPSRQVEGIAIFNHPDNFGGDCPWFTRDYGHMSPSPFNFLGKPWRLDRGAKLSLKYCVVMHAGTPREADLNKIYDEWLAGAGCFVAVRA
jgi:hypothetical protein